MGKKNWIEFDNQENKYEETAKRENFNKGLKINISKQKKRLPKESCIKFLLNLRK